MYVHICIAPKTLEHFTPMPYHPTIESKFSTTYTHPYHW